MADVVSRPLQVAAAGLLSLYCFEERFEIAFSEAAAALSLNDLVEECWTILHRFCEDLEHVAFVVTVHENAKLRQLV
jgi:hypothetical protein